MSLLNRGLIACFALCLPISAAHAQALGTYARAYIHGLDRVNGAPVVENAVQNGAQANQNVSGFAASSATATATWRNGGTGDARGFGDAGIIRAYSATYFPRTDNTDYIETDTRVNVVDRGTISAGGLQIGDPVSLQFSLRVDGIISPDPATFIGTGGSAYMYVRLTVANQTRSANSLDITYTWDYSGQSPLIQTGIFQAFVGDQISITAMSEANT